MASSWFLFFNFFGFFKNNHGKGVLFAYVVRRKCYLVAVFVTVAVRTKTIWNQIS